jgi:8-oxo-dGTP pyrophosphatase MutT (NUDIX family)
MTLDARRWSTLTSSKILERWWMTLRVDHVRLPSGAEMEEFHVAEYPDWALALTLTDDGKAIMVEQYRYAVDRIGLEFPAGAVYPGEDPLEAARRELLEETGYQAREWTTLGKVAVEPSRHTNYGHALVATGARKVAEPSPEQTEDLRVRVVDAASLPQMVEAGEIEHGIHVAAVFWAMYRGLLPGGREHGRGGRR